MWAWRLMGCIWVHEEHQPAGWCSRRDDTIRIAASCAAFLQTQHDVGAPGLQLLLASGLGAPSEPTTFDASPRALL